MPRLRPFVDAFSLASEGQVGLGTPRVPIRVPCEYPLELPASTHGSTHVSAPLSLGESEWRRNAATPFGNRCSSAPHSAVLLGTATIVKDRYNCKGPLRLLRTATIVKDRYDCEGRLQHPCNAS